jgi:hypothetical protein
MAKINLAWEDVETDDYYTYRRARVFGGWLVQLGGNQAGFPSLVFVPDPNGEWQPAREPDDDNYGKRLLPDGQVHPYQR